MEIKSRRSFSIHEKFYSFCKKTFSWFHSKKITLLISVIFIIGIFVIGLFAGLMVTQFFGTFNSPSENAIQMLHGLGISGLREFQLTIKQIKAENIKIPLNYVFGKFSSAEKLYIDMPFENYELISYKREEALRNGILINNDSDYVSATITSEGKKVDIDIRLKGDNTEHYLYDKWSFRVKVKGEDTLFGMKRFGLIAPERRNFLNEFIYSDALISEGILAPRYKLVDLYLNGDRKGIYAIEEGFDKYMLENNSRLDSPIIRFDSDTKRAEVFLYEQQTFGKVLSENRDFYLSSNIDLASPESILLDPIQMQRFIDAKAKLELFQSGNLTIEQVFDVNKLSKYFALSTLFGGQHATLWSNVAFYYNPLTSKLEPIGFDAEFGNVEYEGLNPYTPDCIPFESAVCPFSDDYFMLFFRDSSFYKKYIEDLNAISNKEYLDNFFEKFDQKISTNTKILHKDYQTYHFFKEIYYENLDYLKNSLSPVYALKANIQNREDNVLVIYSSNTHILPVKVIALEYKNSSRFYPLEDTLLLGTKSGIQLEYKNIEFKIPSDFVWEADSYQNFEVVYSLFGMQKEFKNKVSPWASPDESSINGFMLKETNAQEFEFISIDYRTKSINFKNGAWETNRSIILPDGFKVTASSPLNLNLKEGAMIISYSPIFFRGASNNLINIFSSDMTGQGIAVLNAKDFSIFENTALSYFTFPSKDNWALSGAITFYNSPVRFNNVIIRNMKSEDSLNIKNSKFDITNLTILDGESDCLDFDFCEGIIRDSYFARCGNDGLDFSGSISQVENVIMFNNGDKGISAGEKSSVNVTNAKLTNGFIGLASKDESVLNIDYAVLENNKYGIVVYQKKSEYGSASINSEGVLLSGNSKDYLIEKGSSLNLNDKLLLGNTKGVYDILYPYG